MAEDAAAGRSYTPKPGRPTCSPSPSSAGRSERPAGSLRPPSACRGSASIEGGGRAAARRRRIAVPVAANRLGRRLVDGRRGRPAVPCVYGGRAHKRFSSKPTARGRAARFRQRRVLDAFVLSGRGCARRARGAAWPGQKSDQPAHRTTTTDLRHVTRPRRAPRRTVWPRRCAGDYDNAARGTSSSRTRRNAVPHRGTDLRGRDRQGGPGRPDVLWASGCSS